MPDREPEELILWRAFVPKWAHDPLSGEGASRFGGRWNPKGSPTIYAALELSTAWAEYNQNLVQHPALIVQLALSNAKLCDLTKPAELSSYGLDPALHQEDWRAALDEGRQPRSYEVRARLLDEGFDGVIYPSAISRGGSCLALWRWNTDGAPIMSVIDPENRLPKSPASWL